MTTSRLLRIGEVAAATAVTPEALRLYEREGLLPVPWRSGRGARRYGSDVLDRVRFIKAAQTLGLTLRDIRILTDVHRASRRDCRTIRRVLAERCQELDQRLARMQTFRETLGEYLEACDRALSTSDRECPALHALEHGVGQEPRS